MEADQGSESSESACVAPYCSVVEAMKLISHHFDGDKRRLREFIENVDVEFELVHPNKHEILLKFVKTKITGDARSKLMVRFNARMGIGKGNFGRKLRSKAYVRLLCLQDV